MVAVLDSNVAAALAVLVIMSLVNDVLVGLYALVPVVFVLVVQVAIVSVVDVVAVLDSNVAAALAVLVIVALVNDVCHGGVLSFRVVSWKHCASVIEKDDASFSLRIRD